MDWSYEHDPIYIYKEKHTCWLLLHNIRRNPSTTQSKIMDQGIETAKKAKKQVVTTQSLAHHIFLEVCIPKSLVTA